MVFRHRGARREDPSGANNFRSAMLCVLMAQLSLAVGAESDDVPASATVVDEESPLAGSGRTELVDPRDMSPDSALPNADAVADGEPETGRLNWEEPDGPMSRNLAYLEFKTHMDADQFREALPAAELVVKLTEEEFGPEHPEMVTPLNNLATVQEELGEYRASEATYHRSIKIVEGIEGLYGERLVRPLVGLGVVYNSAGQYADGLLAFQRAQHITHRRQGVYNLDQVDILDGQTQSFLGLDEFPEADRSQRLALVVSERKLGKDSTELVPALFKLAKWYQRTFQYANQRVLYRRALDILEAHHGPSHLSLVEPLRGIATSRFLEGIRRSEGEAALERALEIVREQSELESEERVRALVELGDWYITSSKADEGLVLYEEAWKLLETDAELRDDLFGKPIRLLYSSPIISDTEPLSVSDVVGEKFIDLEFTVTRRGRVSNVKVIAANVRNIIKKEVRFAIAKARYRPRLEHGVSVDTPMVKFRQSFTNPRLDETPGGTRTSSGSARLQ